MKKYALEFKIDAEVSVANGRVDAVLELKDKIHIFEFKYKNCPQNISEDRKRKNFDSMLSEGVEQITGRGYAGKYTQSGETIYLVAFAFLGRDNIEMLVQNKWKEMN